MRKATGRSCERARAMTCGGAGESGKGTQVHEAHHRLSLETSAQLGENWGTFGKGLRTITHEPTAKREVQLSAGPAESGIFCDSDSGASAGDWGEFGDFQRGGRGVATAAPVRGARPAGECVV